MYIIKSYKKLFFGFTLTIVLVIICYYLSSEYASQKVIKNFFIAASNENCQKLQPILKYRLLNHDILCPRGDVGNFMVIDKVEYKVKNILGSKLSGTKQVLISVCIETHGVAAWNEGIFKDCTTDPRIIEFDRKQFSWQTDISQFTNISKLINESGAKPESFDRYYQQCWENRITEFSFHGNSTINCNNVVGDEIEYSIRTHKFVQTGNAR